MLFGKLHIHVKIEDLLVGCYLFDTFPISILNLNTAALKLWDIYSLFYLVCPSVCPSIHTINIFVASFSGTTSKGFLKFCFRVYIMYIKQLYPVMRFQIHNSTTSWAGGVSSVSNSSQFHLFIINMYFVNYILGGEHMSGVHLCPSTYGEMRENIERILHYMTTNRIRMHHTNPKGNATGN